MVVVLYLAMLIVVGMLSCFGLCNGRIMNQRLLDPFHGQVAENGQIMIQERSTHLGTLIRIFLQNEFPFIQQEALSNSPPVRVYTGAPVSESVAAACGFDPRTDRPTTADQ